MAIFILAITAAITENIGWMRGNHIRIGTGAVLDHLTWFKLRSEGMIFTFKRELPFSANMIAAIESEDDSKRKKFESLVPRRYQKLFCDFAGVVGSRFYITLEEGNKAILQVRFEKAIRRSSTRYFLEPSKNKKRLS